MHPRISRPLVAVAAVAVLAAACGGDEEDPDVTAYCPAEEALLNAQIALKTAADDDALDEQLDEVERLTEQFQEEAPELIEEQADVLAEETYVVLDEIRDDDLSPADASDRLTGQFADRDVATANAIVSAFDAEFCPEFEGTIPDVPDPVLPVPGQEGLPETVVPDDDADDDADDGATTTSTP